MRAALVDALLAETERAEALGENPAATRLWMHAPWKLKHRYADGHIDAADFWAALRRWIEFSRDRAA